MLRNNEVRSLGHSGLSEFATFTVLCGLSSLAESIISFLEMVGFQYDSEAVTTVVFDAPYGFACQCLAALLSCESRTIVMTNNLCPEYLEDVWERSPTVLLAGVPLHATLVDAIKRVGMGKRYRLTPPQDSILTLTERRMLMLLAHGCSNQEIARQLVMQCQTVRNTLTAIYQKLNVRHRGEAILCYYGIQQALIGGFTKKQE